MVLCICCFATEQTLSFDFALLYTKVCYSYKRYPQLYTNTNFAGGAGPILNFPAEIQTAQRMHHLKSCLCVTQNCFFKISL